MGRWERVECGVAQVQRRQVRLQKNYLLFTFKSDLTAIRAWTIARWPSLLASCRGVFPFNMCIALHKANETDAGGFAEVQMRHMRLQSITCPSHSRQTLQL